MMELLDINWASVVNILLSFIAGMDFNNPVVFWGTSPLWAFPLTLLLYIATMGAKAARDRAQLPLPAFVVAVLFAALGFLLDFYLNVITLTILSLQLPRQWTVSERLKAYHQLTSPANWRERWRYTLSRWICAKLLNPFDPSGEHC